MADMLGIGVQATSAFKRAIEVTSHNVANVATEGFHRQVATISNNSPQLNGSAFLGGGSRVSSIDRVYAGYVQEQLVAAGSMKARYDEQLQLSKQVEGIVASNDEGVQEFMQRFFDSLQALSSNPTSDTSRQMVLEETGNMVSHVQNINLILKDSQVRLNEQIEDMVVEVNNRLENIQRINEQVDTATSNGLVAPNDLLDQRDQSILELAEYIDIQTFEQPNGRVDIHTGDGRLPLISDNTLTKLNSDLSEFQAENRVEIYMTISGQQTEVSDLISHGKLGGILDYRKNMLDQSLIDLGTTLNGMVSAVNWQHYQGYDINGDAGENFFTPLETSIVRSTKNDLTSDDGSTLSVTFNPEDPSGGTDIPPYDGTVGHDQPATYQNKLDFQDEAFSKISDFEARDYVMIYDNDVDGGAGGFYVYDRATDELRGEFPVDSNDPVIIDGFEFKGDDGNYAEGDKFYVSPHQDMVNSFAQEITSTEKIAARGQSPYDPNTGNPIDPSTAEPTAAAIGDNVNMANLASLQTKKILFADESGQPAETLLGGYSKMATNVGMYVRGTEIQLTAQTNVYENIKDRSESLSGVNLDEEASNLLRYQQAYEAAAQIIQTSNTLFQTLIGAVRS